MSRQRYPEEFKIEAVKQVTEKGKPVADVAQRLGMSVHSLYAWIKGWSEKDFLILTKYPDPTRRVFR